MSRLLLILFFSFSLVATASEKQAWMNASLNADQRAQLLLAKMTTDEKLKLLTGFWQAGAPQVESERGLPDSAGFVPGIARLGIPGQFQTDAGVGVASKLRPRTALPSGIATASSWNKDLALAAGTMIGNEARLSGFNVLLAGGINLTREPRNGRNFEYAGEDPLLAGSIVGQVVKGIQTNHILSTVKHFAFNDEETRRSTVNVLIEEAAGRVSDLMAFELAIEVGKPAAVMCSYNRVNGRYACEHPWLLSDVLQRDWKYTGFVMSDWGGTHSTTPAALAGLDQQSGYPFDRSPYFAGALKEAVVDDFVPEARLNDMVTRILRQLFEKGVFDDPVAGDQSEKIDFEAHGKVSQMVSEEGIVLLKNDGLLPLKKGLGKIALIGGHADVGVLSGGGSALVYPVGGSPVVGEEPKEWPGPVVYYPSSPKRAMAAATHATVTYDSGTDLASAAALAAKSDIAIIFATQWTTESVDAPSLNLPNSQDALIEAVANANSKTLVVLETGGPVLMPWLGKVQAVVEAWYPGIRGAEALTAVLTGVVNPSGHLAVTFPLAESQLSRPSANRDSLQGEKSTFDYNIEGAAVGYKWFERMGRKPLFPFGFGLSYTQFKFSEFQVNDARS